MHKISNNKNTNKKLSHIASIAVIFNPPKSECSATYLYCALGSTRYYGYGRATIQKPLN